MTEEEYQDEIVNIEKETAVKKSELNKRYISEFTGRFSSGDIIVDVFSNIIIKVEKISYTLTGARSPPRAYVLGL